MKIIVIVLLAFYASSGFAQDQVQNPLIQPQEGVQGWYQQHIGSSTVIPELTFINRDTGWCNSLYTSDGGSHWTQYPNGRNIDQFIDSLNGWASSPKGGHWISHTMDGGKTWLDYFSDLPLGGPLHFCTPNRGFWTSNNHIASTLDSGKTWKEDTTYVGVIGGFACFDSLHIIAAGGDFYFPQAQDPTSSIFYSSDGGISWKYTMGFPIKNAGFGPFAAFDTATVYLTGGPAPHVYKTTNRGYTIQPFPLPPDAFPNPDVPQAACASDKNNITVVGTSGKIYRSYDGGLNWERQNSTTQNILYAVTFIDSLNGWAAGVNEFILHTGNAGKSWVRQPITIDTLNPQTYPNPANSILNLGITLPLSQHVTISILDLTGHQILLPVNSLMEPRGIQYFPIDVHLLASGTYMVNIQTEKYQSSAKFTVLH